MEASFIDPLSPKDVGRKICALKPVRGGNILGSEKQPADEPEKEVTYLWGEE